MVVATVAGALLTPASASAQSSYASEQSWKRP
jgi:hypothetical protein